MKNISIVIVLMFILINLVGCTTSSKGSDNYVESELKGSTTSQNEVNSNSNKQVAIKESIVGKVDKVIGNEISIKLLADDFELTDEMKKSLGIIELSDSDIKRLEAGELVELADGGFIALADQSGKDPNEGVVDERLPADNYINEFVNEKENESVADVFSRMEFSGASKEIVLKAGTLITNGITGNISSMSDIKKGSIISVEFDENDTIVRIVVHS